MRKLFYLLLIFLFLCSFVALVLFLRKKQIMDNFSGAEEIKNEKPEVSEKLKSFISIDKKNNIYAFNATISGEDIVARINGHPGKPMNKVCNSMKLKNIENNEIKEIYETFNNNKLVGILTKYDKDYNLKPYQWIKPSEVCLKEMEVVGFEDPRFFIFKGEKWIICTYRGNNLDYVNIKAKSAKCEHNIVIFKFNEPKKIIKLIYENRNEIEKNWLPFEYEKQLYIVYSISPHVILSCDVETGECKKVYETEFKPLKYNIGGSTSPIKIKIFDKEYYLSSGHIRYSFIRILRKNFFYLFDIEPPFRPVYYTELFSFEKGKDIEFLMGLDKKDEDTIRLSYGVDDCCNEISEIELSYLQTLMKPYQEKELVLIDGGFDTPLID